MIVKDAYIAGTADASTFWHYGNFYTKAMTFTAGANYVLTRVSLKLYVSSTGSTDNPVITVKLYSTSGGAPSAELAATTTTRRVNELTTNTAGEWYDFDFSGCSLAYGTVYAIYVQIVFGYSGKYVYWKGVSSGNPYGGGCGYEFHDNYPTGWYENANADYDFKTWANSNIYLHSATAPRRHKSADFTGFSFPNPAGSGFTSANDGYALQAGLSADPLLTVAISPAINDSVKISETLATLFESYPNVVDSLNLGEILAAIGSFHHAVIDEIKLSELLIPNWNVNDALIDGLKVGEYPTLGLFYNTALADGIKLGDVLVLAYQTNPTAIDGIKGSDLLISLLKVYSTALDGFNLSEGLAAAIDAHNSLTDGVKLSASPIVGLAYFSALLEGLQLSEALSTLCQSNPSLDDGIKIGDLLQAIKSFYPAIIEALQAGDLPIAQAIWQKILSDGVKAGDAQAIGSSYYAVLSDGLKVSDLPRAFLELLVALIESIKAGDLITAIGAARMLTVVSAITQALAFTSNISCALTLESAIKAGEKMRLVELGETAVCSITVKYGANLADPDTSMKITITDPDGTVVAEAQAMIRDSIGTYHYDYDPTNLGVYTVLYVAVDGTRTSKHKDHFRVRSAS